MRKLLMMSAALAAGMLSLSGATSQAAQPTQQSQKMAAKGMKVTGMVTAANLGKQQITVDGQTFKMAMGGGETVWPQVGADVTLYYQNRNGQKTVTRIG
jgi:opacity protein-like surface antigen